MQKAGTLVKHYRELAFMGFVEVLFNLKTILGNIKYAKMIAEFKPDVIIFIDYPGFNMRIAKWAKEKTSQHTITYRPKYGLGKNRKTSKDVDKMYVILPFETFYEDKHNFPVEFVGHPLIDAIHNHPIVDSTKFRIENQLDDKLSPYFQEAGKK
jgi:lipid-A-disaccharide synthase